MTGLFKGKAVGQIDKILLDTKEYTEQEIKKIIKNNENKDKS